jgi:tRNA G18 (ribose-2'-O)-methylase SpoU
MFLTQPNWQLISDWQDPRVEDYRNLQQGDRIGRNGVFVVEGKVVLNVFVQQSNFRIRSLLLAENRVASLASLLSQVPADVPVFRAPLAVMEKVVGFDIHRGILAIGERNQTPPTMAGFLAGMDPRLLVVAEGVTNHDNMGGIFRNAAAFGAQAVLLDTTSCDPLYRKAIRVSVGGSLLVPFCHQGSCLEWIALLKQQGVCVVALTPQASAPSISEWPLLVQKNNFSDKVALLVGTEGPGLSDDALKMADISVRIPMVGAFDSLNVATAAAIALHRFSGLA